MNDVLWFLLCLALLGVIVALSLKLRRRAAVPPDPSTFTPDTDERPVLAAPDRETDKILERMGESVLLLDP